MAQKLYQLTVDGKKFAQAGTYRFRLGFQKNEGGSTRYILQKKAPILAMGTNEIMATTNEFAQMCIESSGCPSSSRRGGMPTVTPGSPMFVEVFTGTIDVDLDPIFNAA